MEKETKLKLVQFLKENASHTYLRDLPNLVKEKLGINTTISVIKHTCYDNNIEWKRTYRNHANKEIGSEIAFKSDPGSVRIRIGKGKYQTKKRYLYEKYHNVKLNKNDVIIFLNHDFNDYSKENLVKIDRRYMAVLSQIGYTKDANLNNIAIDIAKLRCKMCDVIKENS